VHIKKLSGAVSSSIRCASAHVPLPSIAHLNPRGTQGELAAGRAIHTECIELDATTSCSAGPTAAEVIETLRPASVRALVRDTQPPPLARNRHYRQDNLRVVTTDPSCASTWLASSNLTPSARWSCGSLTSCEQW